MLTSKLMPLSFAIGFTFACSGGGGGTRSNAEACEEIISACHSKDDGMQSFSSCHETAHDGGDCLMVYEECIDACNAAPDITGGYTGTDTEDGSGTGSGSGSGSDTGTG